VLGALGGAEAPLAAHDVKRIGGHPGQEADPVVLGGFQLRVEKIAHRVE